MTFIAIAAFMAFGMAMRVGRWFAAQEWVEASCTLKSVRLDRQHDEGLTFLVSAQYEYDFNGRSYRGDRVWFESFHDNIGDFQKRTYRELDRALKRQQPFHCYVDPDVPSESVLYRELRIELLYTDFLLVVIVSSVGVGLLVFLNRAVRRERTVALMRAQFPNEPWKWDQHSTDGVFHPAADWKPLVVAATVWNAFFGCMAFTQRHESLGAFAIVFLAIGLLFDWKVFLCYRNWLRHGATDLEIRPWPYVVGQELSATLRLPNDRLNRRQLKVTLRVGKSLDGDFEKILFRDVTVITVTDQEARFHFNTPMTLPPSTQTSDPASDSTATWEIKAVAINDKSVELRFTIQAYELHGDGNVSQSALG